MNRDRLERLIHHISTVCDPDELGYTKIAKVLWLSDVEMYRLTGKTVSQYDDYVKDTHGPRHRQFYPAIESLVAAGKVAKRPSMTPVGQRNELVPIAVPDVSIFSAEEIATVDRIALALARLSAKKASELTHDEVWETALFNERMPVAAAASVPGRLTEDLEAWAADVHEHSPAA